MLFHSFKQFLGEKTDYAYDISTAYLFILFPVIVIHTIVLVF